MSATVIPLRPPDKRESRRWGHRLPQENGLAGKLTFPESNASNGLRQAEVLVKPIGHHFSQTLLRRPDGSEVRMQIFADANAAWRCAGIINELLREARA